MKYITTLFIAFITITAVSAQNHSGEIKERANDFITAINDEQYKDAVDMMHPNILKMGGGKESLAIILTEEKTMLKSQGYKILNAEIMEPGAVIKASDELHAIVPVKQLVQINNAKFNSTSYLLAASSDNGKTWTISKLDGHDNDSITFFFPKWNADLKIPQPEQSIAIESPNDK